MTRPWAAGSMMHGVDGAAFVSAELHYPSTVPKGVSICGAVHVGRCSSNTRSPRARRERQRRICMHPST